MKSKNIIRKISALADIFAIIALTIYVFADNVVLDVICGIVIICACTMNLVHLLVRKKHPNIDS